MNRNSAPNVLQWSAFLAKPTRSKNNRKQYFVIEILIFYMFNTIKVHLALAPSNNHKRLAARPIV
jgi:hypothetical protein